MNRTARSGVARFAWAVLAYNLAVILWGAYVRATGSGAGCGSHWPLCNGVVIQPSPTAATLIEYSHRLTSGLALLSVVTLAGWTWRHSRSRPSRTRGRRRQRVLHAHRGRARRRPRALSTGRGQRDDGACAVHGGAPAQHVHPAESADADGLVVVRRHEDQPLDPSTDRGCLHRRWVSVCC